MKIFRFIFRHIKHFCGWYRWAVAVPETEEEKADRQKFTF